MSDTSPILALPFIQPAQAQKHVTHNEALRILDVLVQATVLTRGANTPPATPAAGDRHITGPAPTGLWAGQPGTVALWEDPSGWAFFTPAEGWTAHVVAEDAAVTFIDGQWRAFADRTLRLARLGIGTDAAGTDVLAAAGTSTLLTHAGAGHQLKVNKALATNTASLLFQTGWSGRAEMGTTGSDDFAVKVSSDGALFRSGLVLAAATGIASLPQGLRLPEGTAAAPAAAFSSDPDTGLFSPAADQLAVAVGGTARLTVTASGAQVSGLLTGTAVTQTATDSTAGRLLRTGDFGLGAAGSPAVADCDAVTTTGFWYIPSGGTVLNLPSGMGTGAGTLQVAAALNASNLTQIVVRNSNADAWLRARSGGTWGAWQRIFHAGNVLGTVSQSAGVPTGALVESGSGANGRYRRFACGLQICWRDDLSAASAGTALGSLFRSADVNWTYPIAFLSGAAPVVTASALDADSWCSAGTQGVSSATLRVIAAVTKASAITVRATATGRWF